MVKSPTLCGFRSGCGKLAVVSGFALICATFALPTFAFTGVQPAAVDSAIVQPSADSQDSTSQQNTSSHATASPAPAPTGIMQRRYMFNWGTERQKWADQGFTFDAFYVMDALGDPGHPAGTSEQFDNWKRIRATVDFDFGKMTSAKGLSYHATGLWQNGENLGGVIGAIANPSGLVSAHQFRLDSMWLQQKLLNDRLVITAGLLAAQDFYGLQEYGGSYVIEPLDYNFGNMGNIRASYDPDSGPGAEIKIIPEKHVYLKTAYISPNTRQSSYPTGFEYRQGSFGSTSDTEIGFFTDAGAPTTRKTYPGIIKAGFMYNGGRDFFDYKANRAVSGNYTFYFQANQPVYRMAAGSNRGLDVTFGVNTNQQNKSEVPTEVTAGLIFNGPLKFRAKDGLAFGFVYSKIGSAYNDAVKAGTVAAVSPSLSDEKAFELNYRAQLAPWLLLQPVYQHYSNVGGRQVGSANVAGFRLQTTF